MPPADRSKFVSDLHRINSPALASCPETPLFYVHLGASQRSIVRDMEDQVRAWKARRGEGKTQVQVAKIPDQLAAWDLREGWAGSGYDPARERPFKEVARKLGVPLPTATSRYRAAFEWIAGHPFQPRLWWQLFGPSWLGRPWGPSPAGARRPTSSPVRRPVPDTTVSHAPDDSRREGVVEQGSAVGADAGWSDLLLDLRGMVASGASDIDIARRVGRVDPGVGMAVRARIDDLNLLAD